MKKKITILAALVLSVFVTASYVSGTYAKYTSSATGSDSARVAKWAFDIEGADETNTFAFNLFDTADVNVKAGAGENIIAPGTNGSFELNLENDSEVNAEYSINFTVTNTESIPVEFSINGTDWTTDLTTLNVTDEPINMDGVDALTIYWKWAFEGGNDAGDTALGIDGTATITVQADVTATQVD